MSETAAAGTYKVFGCRLPSGAVAPTHGWVPMFVGAWVTVDDSCANGGALSAALDPYIAHGEGDEAHWSFSAAPNTRIVGFAGNRAARVGAGQPYGSPGVLMHADGQPLEVCTQFYGCSGRGSFGGWNASGNTFAINNLDAATVGFVADCGGGAGGTCPAEDPSAVGSLFRSEVTISDTLDPQASDVSGNLAQSGAHRGTEWMALTLSDQGAGIYRAVVEIDGTRISDRVVDDNTGKCTDAVPGNADAFEFFHKQPCKLSLSTSLSVDTTALTDGVHTLAVKAIDAAGNTATVHGPSSFEVRNHQPPAAGGQNAAVVSQSGASAPPAETTDGGAPAVGTVAAGNGRWASIRAYFARNGRRSLTTRFGTPAVIRGRLVDDRGSAIGNGLIEVAGRSARYAVSLRTQPDGTFSVVLPGGSFSQRVRLRYLALQQPATSLMLKVRAGVRLSVSPRKARNKQAVNFRGRLLGGPMPRGGKLVELQVRFPSGWRTFATARTSRTGAFRHRYRFMRTYSPITYAFRVRVRKEGQYPYETGVSRVVRVRVR